MKQERAAAWQIYRIPAYIGILTMAGLISALLGDDVWDAISWIALCVPVAVAGWYVLRPSKTTANQRSGK